MDDAYRIDPEPEWTVGYSLDESEFVAANRAAWLSQKRDAIASLAQLGMPFIAHLLLLAGILVFGCWLLGKQGSNGPIPWGAAAFNAALAAGCAYYLWDFVYFKNARLRRLFHKSPLAGEKIVYTLSPSRWAMRHKFAESRLHWTLVERVTELRDGFVIQVGGGVHWLPRHAVAGEFADVDIAEFLRSRVRDYRVIDRTACVSSKPAEQPS